MKTMKIATLLLCLSAWMWTGCSDDNEEKPLEPATLELSGDLTLDWHGNSGEVVVTTNRVSWLVAIDKEAEEWCKFTLKRDRLVITPTENLNAESRTATVTVTVENLSKTVTVTQNKVGEIILSAEPKSLTFVWQGESKDLAVTTNMKSWKATSDQTWCQLVQNDNILSVTADQNPTAVNRPATITITAGNTGKITVSVLQQKKEAAIVGMSMAFDVQTDFTKSSVYNVLNSDQKVAEICYEYIPQIKDDGRVIVVYPTDADGKPDLTSGFVVENGGSVIWDKATNACTYTPGELQTPVTKLYVNNHAILTEVEESAPATVLPDFFKDAEKYEYPTVKIGTQYWLAENLRTKTYADGSAIGQDFSTENGAWGLYEDKVSSAPEKSGLLYNWYVVSKIAPAKYHVPAIEEWNILSAYLGSEDAKLMKTTDTWVDEAERGNNYSGFAAYPGGSRWDSGKYTQGGYGGYFWSTTTVVEKEKKYGQSLLLGRTVKSEQDKIFVGIGQSIRLLRD